MNEQDERLTAKRRSIGHLCAISAVILNILVPLLENSLVLVQIGLLLLSLTGYLLAALFYSLSKGRSVIWLVLGLLGPIGLAMLLFGPDYTAAHQVAERQHRSAEAARLAGLTKKTG